jgi:PEP-CTERM motif
MSTILKPGLVLAVATSSLIQMSVAVKADPLYYPIQAVFSDVVYSGYDNGVFTDNSATAPASTLIYNNYQGSNVSTLYWGTGAEVPVGSYYSGLQFYGSYVPFEDTSVPQYLGNLVYSNGSSNADSIIFGATLSFYINGVLLGSDQISITSTSNQYQGNFDLTPSQAQADADYINICGLGSQICATGIQAFESTEGMDGVPFLNPVEAALMGTYIIDPSITLTSAEYIGGDGAVGDRAPPVIPGAPEPSTWAMLLAGFAGLGFLAHRKRNTLPTVGRQFVAES